MPLMPGKSKKAFSKNIEAEMHAGKPQNQALAIAYSVKRKASKKKMAEGGMINESAKSEHRPMPEERDEDSKMVGRNSADKSAKEDSWTDRPDIKQSQKGPQTTRLKHPSMAQSPVFKVKMRDQEDDLQDSASVNNGLQHQPPEDDNEMEADKSGPDLMDKSNPHSKNLNKYAKGGMINDKVSMSKAEEDEVEHPEGLESDNDQMRPSEDEIMADHFAEGGQIDESLDHEMEDERHNSIAAAIMAKRDRMHALIDSGSLDEDEAAHGYAEGGEINGKDSIYSDDSSQADLKRNAEEDANMEDQASYDALRKENYSESAGLAKLDSPHDSNLKGDSREEDEENKHDMISAIRSKMNVKRQFSK